jgi:glycosyltransferase involved in cell wall biosynthesis
MNLADITPLILTYNEQENISRNLAGLAWARQIMIVDSESTDRTAEYALRYSNARVVPRRFDNHTAQWNFGLEQIETPWVLALDADYMCSAPLRDELASLVPTSNAYEANFRYCIYGRPLRGTLYPPRVVLFRVELFRYRGDGHTQTLEVSEGIGHLESVILHDDRKPLSRWLASQSKYADLEVEKLLSSAADQLSWKDRLRKQIVWAPLLTLLYCLFGKRLILDGWRGIFYTLQRVYAELLLSLRLLDARLNRAIGNSPYRNQPPGPQMGNPTAHSHHGSGRANLTPVPPQEGEEVRL